MTKFESETEKILSIVFPEKCASCGCHLNGQTRAKEVLLARFLCKACESDFYRTKGVYDLSIVKRHAFDGFAAPLFYDGAAKEAMLKLKFGSNIGVAPLFATELEREIRTKFYGVKFDILTCVPSTKKSLSERGFNQSQVIAENMKLNITRDYGLLKKNKSTQIQHLLDAESRRRNIESAYSVSDGRNIVGKTILLIDDIMTTGATCDACTRALRLSGAKAVYVACATLTSHEIHSLKSKEIIV